jgi:cellulose synthase/poly-beta-1,6-N-acetylglucosamine synthase-like glycosyltransferase
MLIFFTLRRWFFIFFALWPDHNHHASPAAMERQTGLGPVLPASIEPTVLLLVPLRNEADALPNLVAALDRLDYPAHKLTLVFIDDGSTDHSRELLQQELAARINWHLLPLDRNVGKANALNTALSCFPQGEIIAIYDADERPQLDALRHLVQPFAAAQVGGVSGRRAISNSLASPAASYTTFENLVHQLVTMRAKDRLNLAPALLGANCAYRRTALAEAGNFKPGALLEDSDLTVKLVRLGWQTRFEPKAVSYHQVPQSISGYWRQHTRWARGFNDVARDQAGSLLLDRQLPLLLRLELVSFALGYLDRLALLLGGGLVLLQERRVVWVIALSLLTPCLQIVAALRIARSPAALWRRMIWLPLFFALDIAMAAAGFLHSLANAPRTWEERRVRR